jgi:transformer-2 protein
MSRPPRQHDRLSPSLMPEPMSQPHLQTRPNDYPPPRPRQNHAPVAPNNVLGVFGLSVRTNERDLEDEFGRYGEVEKAVIVYDQKVSQLNDLSRIELIKQSDRSRGFGFVTMRSVEDAQRAMESLNGTVMNGRPVRVDFSATQRAHNPTPGQYKGERKPGCTLSSPQK